MRIWRMSKMSLSLGRRRWRFVAGLCISCVLAYLTFSYYNQYHQYHLDCDEYLKPLRKSSVRISPPEIPLEDSSKIRNNSTLLLGDIVWRQITEIQGRNCNTPNFQCGHYQFCGYGCQIHHRAACLMMSYVLQMPLIHNTNDTGWMFSTSFHSLFLPIGSDCPPTSNTYSWNWAPNANGKLANRCLGSPTNNLIINNGDEEEIRYPLAEGLSVPDELAEAVAKVTPDEFLWWTGQFVKYTLRLNAHTEKLMEEYKRQIGFSSPIVGAHVRRTDKRSEANGSYHELQEYFQAAEEYFSREEESRGVKLPRRIFLASDDSQVLPQARANWSSWEVQGFQDNVTLLTQWQRRDALGGIVRDVHILSSCHFIICGISSNVCRLLLELISADGSSRLKNLDGRHYYYYQLQGLHSIPTTVNKVPKENWIQKYLKWIFNTLKS